MPTFVHSKNTGVYFGGYDISSYMRSVSFPATIDTAETTAFRSTAKSYVIGNTDETVTMEGMFSFSNVGPKEIGSIVEDYAAQEAPVPFALAMGKGVVAIGDVIHGGVALETNVSYTSSNSDIVGVSVTLQSTGTSGRSLALTAPESTINCAGATIAGTEVDYTPMLRPDYDGAGPITALTSFPKGGLACLQVLSNTVNASTVCAIQSRAGVGTWADIHTPWSVPTTAIGGYHAFMTTDVKEKIRFNIATTGTGALKVLAYFIPLLVN
jgi:hypothetical protein